MRGDKNSKEELNNSMEVAVKRSIHGDAFHDGASMEPRGHASSLICKSRLI